METLTFRPKRDRRTQPRLSPQAIARRAYELYKQRGKTDTIVTTGDQPTGPGYRIPQVPGHPCTQARA